MANHTNLVRRKGIYYFRMRVPADLMDAFGREFNASLKTSDLREALPRLRLKQGEAPRKFDAEREARARQARLASARLSRSEASEILNVWFTREREATILRDRSLTGAEEVYGALEDLYREQDRLQSPLPTDHEPIVGGVLNRLLIESGASTNSRKGKLELSAKNANQASIVFEPDVSAWLFETVRSAQLDLCQARIERFNGTNPASWSAPKVAQSVAPSAAYTLGDLIAGFRSDPSRMARTDKTDLDYGMVFKILVEAIGSDRPVSEITRDDCRDLQRFVQSLPRDATKRFPGKTFRFAVEQSASLPKLKPSTVNSHIAKIATLFNWAVKEQKLTHSPARGLGIKSEPSTEEEGRRPFTVPELTRMFSAPLYAGCIDDERNFSRPGLEKPRRSRFWVPLIALFSGLRLNEICQLSPSDVGETDGVPIIHVRAGQPWQRLKTPNARRSVPIHPELLKIGLASYAAQRLKAGEQQLFPELALDSRGYMSGAFQKRFNSFRKSAGINDADGVFHSFRHTWRDALREAGVPEEVADQLGGWSRSGEGARYGRGLSAKLKLQAIEGVKYVGLSLDHLKH